MSSREAENMKIGFFDSGLGGLLILQAVVRELPQYDYVYYGDTANLPYGDKSEEEIYEFTKVAVEELFSRDCILVIIACNTASAETLRRLQDTILIGPLSNRRILGVIVPTVEVVAAAKPKRVVLMATKRTVESGKYERELKKLDPALELISVATPGLVPRIEAGQDAEAIAMAKAVLEAEAREGSVVILGCTHYTLLTEALREHFGDSRMIISQAEVIPSSLKDYLARHREIVSRLSKLGSRTIILSEHRPDYDRLTAEFLGGVYMKEE